MASFFDEISANRAKSLLLMAVFTLFFLGIIFLLELIFGGGLFLLILGFILILIYAAFVYFAGDKVILKTSGAQPADPDKYRDLYEVVEGLALATQIPKPKVYVINDPNPNAFATGKNKKAASIAVTSGLLGMMDKSELEGVLAHETSHIADNDIQFMMIAIVFAGAIGLIAAVMRGAFLFGGISGRGRNGGSILIIALVIGLLAPVFALLIRLAISRRREYMADANGARITRNPAELASALTKIKQFSAQPKAPPVKHANEVNASLYFANPFNSKSFMNLFSTHPPIDDRIDKLQHMY